jgi:hypothetical protein
MIEYRQYVPEDGTRILRTIRQNVAAELSRQASATDDPDEFYVEALANISERPSKNGGTWVHSYLNRPRNADYTDPLYSAPFKVPVPFAKDHVPVDYTPDALRIHLEEKAARS